MWLTKRFAERKIKEGKYSYAAGLGHSREKIKRWFQKENDDVWFLGFGSNDVRNRVNRMERNGKNSIKVYQVDTRVGSVHVKLQIEKIVGLKQREEQSSLRKV